MNIGGLIHYAYLAGYDIIKKVEDYKFIQKDFEKVHNFYLVH